ncbi:MAG: type II toxin-antitoxin system RelE/ParE family toxin [Verrucomicrobiota bacterium]
MAFVGTGKSGGARVIYLYLPEDHVLYLFLLFNKSDAANLSKSQRNQLGILAEQIKSSYAQKRQNP